MTIQQHKAIKVGDTVKNNKSGKMYTVIACYENFTNWGATSCGWRVIGSPNQIVIDEKHIKNWEVVL